ncbi:Zormin [Strongyloides ratti]|uniref:Zormin n=1 Tax=Strongyloides ratti TaxID=34506 RepID=A0A090KY20_STRRB|nr:Zormin [Strongyloides ratti]CEF62415.1 Zormin [Strongyloides ratti]
MKDNGENTSTTTLSTIAINAKNNAIIVLAMLKSVDYIALRVTSMNPPLLEVGENLRRSTTLHEMHKDLMQRLNSKQQQVDELLTRADQLVVEQKDTDIYVYDAMAKSLAIAWKELLKRLEMRGYLLKDTVAFYQMAGNHEELCEQIKGMLRGKNNKQLNDAMNEIIDITCEAVELGAWIITQLRTLGALSDDDESIKEVLNSCLLIEKSMLTLTANWELVGELKRRAQEEEDELEKMIPIQIEKSREPPKIKDLEDEISEIEKWFNRTELAFQKNPNIASDLIPEIKSQKNSLTKIINFIDSEPKYYHLTPRCTNLMTSIESFLRLLENNQKGHKKFNQFINACDILSHQLDNMITDLKDGTPSMAGELAPLARSKVKALLDFGNELIKNQIEGELVLRKCNELQKKLSQIELIADRIILGQNDRFNNEIDRIDKWIKEKGEYFLKSHSTFGNDFNESCKFLIEHENFGREMIGKQHEINGLAKQLNAHPPNDKNIIDKFIKCQQDFENLGAIINNRIKLGSTYNQVTKFGKDLDTSFNTLVNLLNEERNFNDNNVATRMVNVFHAIQETLTQEKHHSDKFINDIDELGDDYLDKNTAKQQMYKMQESHYVKFNQITEAWNDWQQERTKVIQSKSSIEEIQTWEEETVELIRLLEDKLTNVVNEEEIKTINEGINRLETMIPEIKEKIKEIINVKSEIVDQVIDRIKYIEEKSDTLKKKFEIIKEKNEDLEGYITMQKQPQVSATETIIPETEEISEWQSFAYTQIKAIKDEIKKDMTNKVQFGKIENVIYNVEKALPTIKQKIQKIIEEKCTTKENIDKLVQMQNIIEEETTFVLEEVYKIKINDDNSENVLLKETIYQIQESQEDAITQIQQVKHEIHNISQDIQIPKVEEVIGKLEKAIPRIKEKLDVVITKIPPRTPQVCKMIERQKIIDKEVEEIAVEINKIKKQVPKINIEQTIEEVDWIQKEVLENIDNVKPTIVNITSEEEITRVEDFVANTEKSISLMKPKIEVIKTHITMPTPQVAKLVEVLRVIEEETIIMKEDLEQVKFALQRDVEEVLEEVSAIQNGIMENIKEVKATVYEITENNDLNRLEDIVLKAEKAISYTKPKIDIIISKVPSSKVQVSHLMENQRKIEEETRIIKDEIQKLRTSIPIKKVITEITTWQVDILSKIEDTKKEINLMKTKEHASKVLNKINGIEKEIPEYHSKISTLKTSNNGELVEVKQKQKIIEEETTILREDFQKILLDIENQTSVNERKKSIVEEINILQCKCFEKINEMKSKVKFIATEEHVKQFDEMLQNIKKDVINILPEKINKFREGISDNIDEENCMINKQQKLEEELLIIEEDYRKIKLTIPKEGEIAKKILDDVKQWQDETLEKLEKTKKKIKHIVTEDEVTYIQNDIFEIEKETHVYQNKISEGISHCMEPSLQLNEVMHKQKIIEEEISILLNEIEIINKNLIDNKKQTTIDETMIIENIEERLLLKPRIITPLIDIQANEGDKIDIVAKISGSPPPIVKWMKDGKPITETNDVKMSSSNGIAKLTITEVFITDSAIYTIAISNPLGHDESSATLNVKESQKDKEKSPIIGKPVFVKELTTTTVDEGDIIILDCIVKSSPEPEIIWYKEEELIIEDFRRSLKFIGDHCTLTIKNCNLEDSGLYKCLAKNINGQTINFCKVTVQKRGKSIPPKTPPKPKSFILPSPPAFVPSLVDVTVEENDKAEFFVKVSGEPKPVIEWKFEEKHIIPNDRIQITSNDDGWNHLIINNVYQSDVGLYTITANNESGEARSGATLNIIPKIGTIKRNGSIKSIDDHKLTDSTNDLILKTKQFIQDHGGYWTDGGFTGTPTPPPIPRHRINQTVTEDYGEIEYTEIGLSPTATIPEFIKPLPNEFTLNEGEEGTIECMMVGNPRPKIEWYFNDTKISNYDKTIEIKCSGDTYSLTFKNPTTSLSGFYKIIATNLKGTGESATVIHVRPKSLIPTPVRSYNKPPPFWRQSNGSQDKAGELYRNVLKSTDLSGKYGSTDDSISISKNEISGQAPHFSQTLTSTVSAIGESATFEGMITGWPVPEIIWSKDNIILNEYDYPHIVSSYIGSKVRLTFRKTSPDDSGKYICTAKNAFGMATSSAQLVVRPKTIAPDFLKRLISEEAIKGQSLRWQVKLSGDPEPKVTWLINGVELKNGENGFYVEYEGNSTYSMIIPEVNASHGGQYTCLAENIAGEARSTADLVVRNPDQAPGNYFHVTKVMEGTRIGNEEISKNEVFSIENPKVNF